jgi:hypothetical protein
MRQSIGSQGVFAGSGDLSGHPCGIGSGSFKLGPAAKSWGNRVAWEMAMPRVFGRRPKLFASEGLLSVLRLVAERHARRALSANPPNEGRESPVRNFMVQCELQALGRPDGGMLKGMKGSAEVACQVFA